MTAAATRRSFCFFVYRPSRDERGNHARAEDRFGRYSHHVTVQDNKVGVLAGLEGSKIPLLKGREAARWSWT